MSRYKITTDLFTLPYKDGQSVLYAPLVGFVGVANEDLLNFLAGLETIDDGDITPAQKEILDHLEEKGVVNGSQSAVPRLEHGEEVSPAKLTLFPTNQCNLNCRYCYASPDGLTAKSMDWEVAISAIQYFLTLMKKEGTKTFMLEFHGGGEPFFAWNLVQRIITFAEERCSQERFELRVYAASNGVLNERQLDWVLGHVTSVVVSFDGLPRVQDYHRATVNNNGSFEYVDRTIRYFDQHNFPYAIRCTVSKYNEDLLDATIDFVTQNYKTKLLFLEPVNICGCSMAEMNQLKPDLYKFIKTFKRLEPICTARGLRMEYSGALFEKISPTFCYVGTDNFAVTPDGYLTNCWEVTSKAHPLAETFIFGRMLPGGKISVDQNKLDYLRSLSVEQLHYCRDCFAKWHCAGDCVTRLGHNQYHGPRGGERCETNRQIIAHRLIQMLERENYFQKN